MPFGLWARIGPENRVRLGSDPPWVVAIFGERGTHIKVQGHSVVTCAKTAESIVMPFGLWSGNDPRNLKLDGLQIPHEKGQFGGKGSPIVKYRDFLPWTVQKQLNRSICHLRCGLGWAEGSTSSIIFARWRQCAHMVGHIWRHLANTIQPSVCGSDAVLCQITLTTCYYYH